MEHLLCSFFSLLPFGAMSLWKPPKMRQRIRQSAPTDRLATCKNNVRTRPRKRASLNRIRAIDRWKKRRSNIHTRATRRDEVSDP